MISPELFRRLRNLSYAVCLKEMVLFGGIEVSRISGIGGDIVERIVHTRRGDLTIRLFEYAGGRIVGLPTERTNLVAVCLASGKRLGQCFASKVKLLRRSTGVSWQFLLPILGTSSTDLCKSVGDSLPFQVETSVLIRHFRTLPITMSAFRKAARRYTLLFLSVMSFYEVEFGAARAGRISDLTDILPYVEIEHFRRVPRLHVVSSLEL